MDILNALRAVQKHPRIISSIPNGWEATNSAFWRLEDEKYRRKYLGRWNSYFREHPDGLMHMQGFDIYVPHSYYSFSMLEGVYEPKTTEVFKSLINEDSLVVDVGANIGYFSLLAAARARKVHAFEPASASFSLLEKSIERNGYTNIHLHKICLLDKAGTTNLYLASSALRHSTLPRDDMSQSIAVECSTLDSFFPTETIDMLKIDVEGAELKVLEGAKELIRGKKVRNIVMEWNQRIWETKFGMAGFKSKLMQEGPIANILLVSR